MRNIEVGDHSRDNAAHLRALGRSPTTLSEQYLLSFLVIQGVQVRAEMPNITNRRVGVVRWQESQFFGVEWSSPAHPQARSNDVANIDWLLEELLLDRNRPHANPRR